MLSNNPPRPIPLVEARVALFLLVNEKETYPLLTRVSRAGREGTSPLPVIVIKIRVGMVSFCGVFNAVRATDGATRWGIATY